MSDFLGVRHRVERAVFHFRVVAGMTRLEPVMEGAFNGLVVKMVGGLTPEVKFRKHG